MYVHVSLQAKKDMTLESAESEKQKDEAKSPEALQKEVEEEEKELDNAKEKKLSESVRELLRKLIKKDKVALALKTKA